MALFIYSLKNLYQLSLTYIWVNVKGNIMSNHHTYKKLEIVGTSPNSIEEAIQNAITETANSVNNIDWFEVTETRGHIIKNKITHYQVTIKIGFRIENS